MTGILCYLTAAVYVIHVNVLGDLVQWAMFPWIWKLSHQNLTEKHLVVDRWVYTVCVSVENNWHLDATIVFNT